MDIPIAQQNIHFPGYGMFWLANSISSALLGRSNRLLQEKAHERNQEFQLEMERARNITEDERLQEEMAFKRRMVTLSRQYRQEEAISSFNNQMKAVELQAYLQRCWPLDQQLPYVILDEIACDNAAAKQRLNVILMRAPLLPQKKYGGANEQDAVIYDKMEYAIMRDDVPCIGNLKYRKDACVKADLSGGNASIMNIHFLMSQLPTLVISPCYSEGRMSFSGAVWEPQAARPFVRPLFGFDYSPVDALESKEYQDLVIEKFHSAVSIITGVVRDSYMLLTQGRTPTLQYWLNDEKHVDMKQIALAENGMCQFVRQECKNLLAALEESNTPHLLEAFSREDVDAMKEQIKSTL
jgi:hypothetical protein